MRPDGTRKVISFRRYALSLFSVGLGISLCACAPTRVPINTQIGFLGVKQLPMDVGLVIPESVKAASLVQDVPCAGNLEVPIGTELEKAASLALSQAFESVEIARSKVPVEGQHDVLVELAVPQLKIDGHCGGAVAAALLLGVAGAALSKRSVEAEASIGATVVDKSGQTLLADTYRSGLHTKTFGGMEEAYPHVGLVVGEALGDALQGLTRALTASAKIRSIARSVGGRPEDRGKTEDTVVKSSDVDDPPKSQVTPVKNRHAVVIGIEQYREQLPKANYASQDAKVIGKYLTAAMGYPEENVAVLLDHRATKTDIEKYLEGWLPNRVEKDDVVFVYFSGHGSPNPKTGDAYLLPYDGDPNYLATTGYSLKRLYEQLVKLPAKQVAVVLDSCFSGAGGRSVLAQGIRPAVISVENPILASGNTVVLTASSGAQISSTYGQKAHGLLTYFFLKGLHGEADQNQDGKIDLSEIHAYVKPRVEGVSRREFNNEQTPQLLGSPQILSQGVPILQGTSQ